MHCPQHGYLSIYEMETSNAVITFDHKLGGVRGAQGMVIGMMLLPGINELSSSATAVPPQILRL